jgi:hypothetical protein
MWEHVTTRRPPVLPADAEPGPLLDLYERLHPDRDGAVEIARDGDAQDALAEYIAAGAAGVRGEEGEGPARRRSSSARWAARRLALLGDSVAFEYVEQAREHCDTSRLAERWPDAYADCVEDRHAPPHLHPEATSARSTCRDDHR